MCATLLTQRERLHYRAATDLRPPRENAVAKPPPIPEPTFKRPLRQMGKVRDKRVVRLDSPQLAKLVLALVLLLSTAFTGGVLVEQSWPSWSWWPWLAQQLAPVAPKPPLVAVAPDQTPPPSADAVMTATPEPANPRPAQTAAVPPLLAPGRVDPIEMGPRRVDQASPPPVEIDAEHPAATGGGGVEDQGTLDMPTFVLDTGERDALAYTIQVKAFREEPQAQAYLDQLRQGGYDAWLVQSDLPDQGVWWRVRVGRFATMTEATDYQRLFEEKENVSTFVSPL